MLAKRCNRSKPQNASARPRVPPIIASTPDSVSSCATNRRRLRAERRAQCHFAPARMSARQGEIGNVGASDEEKKTHCAEQHEQRIAQFTGDHFLQTYSEKTTVGFVGRIVDPLAQQFDFGLQAVARNTGLKSPNHTQEVGIGMLLENRALAKRPGPRAWSRGLENRRFPPSHRRSYRVRRSS